MPNFIDASDNGFRSGAGCGAFKGAVKNLGNIEYHALESYWSSTDLKFMKSLSPAHFNQKYFQIKNEKQIRKPRESFEPTKDMILGSLVHCLVLTPDTFQKEFFVMPDLNMRTNEGKAVKEKLLSENPFKLAITDEMLVTANDMKSAVFNHKRASQLLSVGLNEAAYFWTCPYSGLNFKAKLDQSSSGHWCELKTTHKGAKDHFERHVDDMNWDLSIFHYRTGMEQAVQMAPPAHFITVERDEPHVVTVYKVGEGFYQTGHSKWLDSVTKLEAGIKEMKWPGYFPEDMEVEINPPPWIMRKLESEAASGI